MKKFFKAIRFMAIYIVALVSFTTLSYASEKIGEGFDPNN